MLPIGATIDQREAGGVRVTGWKNNIDWETAAVALCHGSVDINAKAANVMAIKIILRLFIVPPSNEKRNYLMLSKIAK